MTTNSTKKIMLNNKEPIFLIDVMPFVHSKFSGSKKYKQNSKGQDTLAITGTLDELVRIIDTHQPKNPVLVFDSQDGYFRSEIYPEYKSNRKEKDPQLVAQINGLMRLCRLLGFPVFCVPKYEAEDVIGTIAHHFAQQGHDVTIYSTDQDFIKIIDDNITFIRETTKDKNKILTTYTKDNAHELLNIPFEHTIDYLALRGNASDNIPGIEGVGENTATQLISEYGSIDEIYRNVDNQTFFTEIGERNLKTSINLLKYSREDVYTFAQILKIKTDVDLGVELNQELLQTRPANLDAIVDFLQYWDLKKISDKIKKGEYLFLHDSTNVPDQYAKVLKEKPKFATVKLTDVPKEDKKSSSNNSEEENILDILQEKQLQDYELTHEDQKVQESTQSFVDNFQAFIANATIKTLFQIKDYLEIKDNVVVNPDILNKLVAQVKAKCEVPTTLESKLIKSINRDNKVSVEEIIETYREDAKIQGIECQSDLCFDNEIIIKSLATESYVEKVNRWIAAIEKTREEIKTLLSSAVSVSFNYQVDNTKLPLAISIAILHKQEDIQDFQEFTLPTNLDEIAAQELKTTCFKFDYTKDNAWGLLSLKLTDFVVMHQVLRELLIKPLFLAKKSNLEICEQIKVEANSEENLLQVIDSTYEFKLLPHTQIFTNSLQNICENFDFSPWQVFMFGDHIHDLEQVCYLRNSRKSKTKSFAETINKQFGIALDTEGKLLVTASNTQRDITIFMNCMGIYLASIMQSNLYRDIEQNLYKFLYFMHCSKLSFNLEKFNEIKQSFEAHLQSIKEEIFKISQIDFNLKSAKDKAHILYDVLGLPDINERKTDEETLKELGHPICKLLLKATKFTNQFINKLSGLENKITPHNDLNVVNFDFIQNGHHTGRIETDPDLTDLPQDEEVVKQIYDSFNLGNLKEYKLVYFNIELLNLRIAAHLSQDSNLISDLETLDNFNLEIASKIFQVETNQITEQQHQITSIIIQNIVPDVIRRILTEEIGIPSRKVTKLLKEFFNSYSTLEQYMQNTKKRVQVTGFIRTMSGRIIHFENINSSFFRSKQADERDCQSYPILGSAAETLKLALNKLLQAIVTDLPKTIPFLTTEDGLLVAIPEYLVEEYARKIQQIIESSAQQPNIKFPVKYYVGESWTGYNPLL